LDHAISPPDLANSLISDSYKRDENPLSPLLGVHPPGSIVGNADDLKAERSPLLLSIQRHRRIPIDWGAAIDIESTPRGRFNVLRQTIESMWLRDADALDIIPSAATNNRGKADAYVVRRLNFPNLVAGRPWFDESPIPTNALVVGDPVEDKRAARSFALVPAGNAALEGGRSTWAQVGSAIEVFRKTQSDAEKAQASLVTLGLGVMKDLLESGQLESTTLPQISSDIDLRSLRARILVEWREALVKDLLAKNIA
jgi:hypothetical protein